MTVGAIFVTAMVIQIPYLNVSSQLKIVIFVGWAMFGILPTMHWAIKMGGFHNRMVAVSVSNFNIWRRQTDFDKQIFYSFQNIQLLIPRVIGMYILSGIAFLIYIAKIPERWMVGRVDFFGHSHNWWHFFVLAALYYWHNTGNVLHTLCFTSTLLWILKFALQEWNLPFIWLKMDALKTEQSVTHSFYILIYWQQGF